MIYLQLFWEFFQTGLFAVGGGLATLPFLQSMAVRYPWFTAQQLADMIAVAESTPGPIGINMATFAGIRAAGLGGAAVATFAEVLPSMLVIMLVTAVLTKFRENRFVQSVLSVLRPVSVGLIGAAVWSVVKVALLRPTESAPFAVSWYAVAVFIALAFLRWKAPKWHPIVFIALGAAAGILLPL